MTTLKIADTFVSIQGEGHLVGNRMLFIRFAGCSVGACELHPVNSGLCDEHERWSKSGTRAVDDLLRFACESLPINGWVSITGGEPADQLQGLRELVASLRRAGFRVLIETSGARPLTGTQWDWLCVSPKTTVDKIVVRRGVSDLKLVYDGHPHYAGPDPDCSILAGWYQMVPAANHYLQPLWGPDGPNTEATIHAVHKANKAGMHWKLSPQLHKMIGVR